MRLLQIFPALRALARQHGWRGVAAKLWERAVSRRRRDYLRAKLAADAAFDAAHDSDTGGVQLIHTLSAAAPLGSNHLAVPAQEFAAALGALDLAPDGLVFMDLGSGKGRALLLAAERPFRRIIGVELAAELHAIAEANVAARARRHGPDPRIELRLHDAMTTPLPEEPLLLFLFNPFGAAPMKELARRALAAWRAHPRPMRVLYLNPRHEAAWLEAGWKRLPAGIGYSLLAPVDLAAKEANG